jgi:uncharacterized membrane protein
MFTTAPTRNLRILVTSLALLTSVALSAGIPALAQIKDPEPTQQVGLAAIPPRAGENGELKAAPGEVIQTVIKVRNISDQPISIHSVAQDFIIDEDGETPIPVQEDVSQRWSLASWVTVSPEYQDLAPNQIGQVNVLITVPQDALPGGHYAMITHQPTNGTAKNAVETVTTQEVQESAAVINQRVGTLFYTVIDGPINEEAFIRDFQIPTFTEFGPVPLSLSVDNQSDIHIKPRITIEITNLFGQTVDTIQLEEKNIFPLSSRGYNGMWDRMWGIGPYKATATMSFGTTGQIVMSHQNFWLFPITLLWVAIVVILVLVVIIIAVRRHLHHRVSQDKARVEMLEQRLAELEKERITKQ